MKTAYSLAALTLVLGSCKMSQPPAVTAKAQALSQYVFRGLPMTARPVVQGSMTADFEARGADRLKLTSWHSMSITASNGDAVFSNSDIGDLDESRLIADYHHAFDHRLLENFHAGVINYGYAALGGSTRELFAGTHWDWDRFTSQLDVFWDIDERDGLYINKSVRSGFDFNEEIPGWWKVGLGFGTSNFNDTTYGDNDAGLADLTAELGATKEINENTTMHGLVALSHLFVDDDALDARSINITNFWIGVGLNWTF